MFLPMVQSLQSLATFFKKASFLFCVCGCFPTSEHVSHVVLVPSEARREHLEPLELELQAVVGHYVGAGS